VQQARLIQPTLVSLIVAGLGYPAESREHDEAGRASGPVSANDLGAGVSDHTAKHDADDDDVVGVPDDRDDVGHNVDRECEVGEQDEQAQAYSSSEAGVAGESVNEPDGVGHDAGGITQRRSLGAEPGETDEQHDPQDHQRDDDADHDGDQHGHRGDCMTRRQRRTADQATVRGLPARCR
jgi:hypothetical protein